MILHGRLQIIGAGQTFQVLRLPDFPGWVVQVHRVKVQFETFSEATSVGSLLAHDIGPGFTFQTGEPENAWNQLFMGATAALPGLPNEQVYDPAPYELAGAQRWVVINAAGTVIVRLSVLYSLRREPNKVLWTALRLRTSFSSSLT